MPTSVNYKTEGGKASRSRSKPRSSPQASLQEARSNVNPQVNNHVAQQRHLRDTHPPSGTQRVVRGDGEEGPRLPKQQHTSLQRQPSLPEADVPSEDSSVGLPSNNHESSTTAAVVVPNHSSRKRARILKAEPKSRKKSERSDDRWSSRFNWSEELHRDFVRAVFSIGLQQAEPAALLEAMPKQDSISMNTIHSYLAQFKQPGDDTNASFVRLNKAGGKNNRSDDCKGGESKVQAKKMTPGGPDSSSLRNCSVDTMKEMADDTGKVLMKIIKQNGLGPTVMMPHEIVVATLTQAEQGSELGETMGCLMGLFLQLKTLLRESRSDKNDPINPSIIPLNSDNTQGHNNATITDSVVPTKEAAAQKEGRNESERKQEKRDDSSRKKIQLLDFMQKDMLRSSAVQQMMRAMKERQDSHNSQLAAQTSTDDAQLKEPEAQPKPEVPISRKEDAETEPTVKGVNSDNQNDRDPKESDKHSTVEEESGNDVALFDFLLSDH